MSRLNEFMVWLSMERPALHARLLLAMEEWVLGAPSQATPQKAVETPVEAKEFIPLPITYPKTRKDGSGRPKGIVEERPRKTCVSSCCGALGRRTRNGSCAACKPFKHTVPRK
jgi:hypothetical protein